MKNLNLINGQIVVYRQLCKGDEQILQEFDKDLSDKTRELFAPHSYDDETVAKIIARAESGEDLVYIAIDSEKVVAYFFLWWAKTEFPILGIGISDDFQGKGLGKQIIKILIDDGRNAGCTGIELTTLLYNKRAFTLYEKMGFELLGEVDNINSYGIVREWHMFYPFRQGIVPPARKHEPPV